MMSTRGMVAALLAVSAVACGSSGPASGVERTTALDPGTSIDVLAFSDECAACARLAVDLPCAAERDGCAGDPECSAVADCVADCAEGDARCRSACEASGADTSFADLASCVVCDACPSECSGSWECSSPAMASSDPVARVPVRDLPSACDGSGSCADCMTCAMAECLPNLDELAEAQKECLLRCDPDDSACTQPCLDELTNAIHDVAYVPACLLCTKCPTACAGSAPELCGGE